MPVKIHGKEYITVAERVADFHKNHKENRSIITEIIQFKDGVVVVKAVVKTGDDVFTGHAYEDIGSTKINTTSALENCETSAIGRALASGVTNIAPKAQTDFSNDKWRDNPIGFKSGKNEGKSYREVDDDTLIWIINQCKVESWKEKAIKEMQLRQDGQQASVSKKEVDDLFNTNEGDQDAK